MMKRFDSSLITDTIIFSSFKFLLAVTAMLPTATSGLFSVMLNA